MKSSVIVILALVAISGCKPASPPETASVTPAAGPKLTPYKELTEAPKDSEKVDWVPEVERAISEHLVGTGSVALVNPGMTITECLRIAGAPSDTKLKKHPEFGTRGALYYDFRSSIWMVTIDERGRVERVGS